MKWTILLWVFVIFGFAFLFAEDSAKIKGGKVVIQGGYLNVGPQETPVLVSTTTGQCIGILCGITDGN